MGNGAANREWPPKRWRRILAWTVGIVLFGLITHGHYAGSGDALHYLVITHSLAFGLDLDVADEYRDPDNIVTKGEDIAGRHVRAGRGGIVRPVHDVGMPLLWAPYYAAVYKVAASTPVLPEGFRRRTRLDSWITLRQLMSLSVIVVTALLAGVFFDLALQLSGRTGAAAAATLLWALSPPVLTHGYVFFTEMPTALAALVAYRLLLNGHRAPPSRVTLAGLLSGLLLLLHVRNVGLTLGLALVGALRLRGDRGRLVALLLPVALAVLGRTLLTYHLWGTLVTTPHANWTPWTGVWAQAVGMIDRGMALLFDQEHGLLLWAPHYLLAPVGWLLLFRRSRAVAIELLALSAIYLVPILVAALNPHGWRGGWSPAARFLVPVAAFLGLPIAMALAEKRLRLLSAPVVAVQVGLSMLFWSRPMLTWAEASGAAPFLPAIGLGDAADWLPSWHRDPEQALVLSAVALTAWATLSVWAGRRAR